MAGLRAGVKARGHQHGIGMTEGIMVVADKVRSTALTTIIITRKEDTPTTGTSRMDHDLMLKPVT